MYRRDHDHFINVSASVAKESINSSTSQVSAPVPLKSNTDSIVDLEEGRDRNGDEFVNDEDLGSNRQATEKFSVHIDGGEGHNNGEFETVLDDEPRVADGPTSSGCRGVDIVGAAMAALGVMNPNNSDESNANKSDFSSNGGDYRKNTVDGTIIEPVPEMPEMLHVLSDDPPGQDPSLLIARSKAVDEVKEYSSTNPTKKKSRFWFFGRRRAKNAGESRVQEEISTPPNTPTNATDNDIHTDTMSTVSAMTNKSHNSKASSKSSTSALGLTVEERQRLSRFQHFLANIDNQSTFSATTGTGTRRTRTMKAVSVESGDFDDTSTIPSVGFFGGPADLAIQESDSEATQGISNVANKDGAAAKNQIKKDDGSASVNTSYSGYSAAYTHREVHNDDEGGIIIPRRRRNTKLQAIDEVESAPTTDILDDVKGLTEATSTLSALRSKKDEEEAGAMTSSVKKETKKGHSHLMDALLHDPRRKKAAAESDDDDASLAKSIMSHFMLNSANEMGIVPNIVPVGSYSQPALSKEEEAINPTPNTAVTKDLGHFDNDVGQLDKSQGSIVAIVPIASTQEEAKTKQKSPKSPKRLFFRKKMPSVENAIGEEEISDSDTTVYTMSTAGTSGKFTHFEYKKRGEKGVVLRDMLREDEIEELKDYYDDDSEYTDFSSVPGSMSGITGYSAISTYGYGRSGKPARAKSSRETFAHFLGLGDDMSTFSQNTGMSSGMSNVFSGAKRERSGLTERSAVSSRQQSGLSEGSEMSRCQQSGLSEGSEMSRCQQSGLSEGSDVNHRQPSGVKDEGRQSSDRRSSGTESRQGNSPLPTVDSFAASEKVSAPADVASTGGACMVPHFIRKDDASRLTRAAAPLLLDDKSTFSEASNASYITAPTIRTLATKQSHYEVRNNREMGVVHKSVLKPPKLAVAASGNRISEDQPASRSTNKQDVLSDLVRVGSIPRSSSSKSRASRSPSVKSSSSLRSSAPRQLHASKSTARRDDASVKSTRSSSTRSSSNRSSSNRSASRVDTSEFNTSHLAGSAKAHKTSSEDKSEQSSKSSRSAGSFRSYDSSAASASTPEDFVQTIDSKQSTALVMNRAPPSSGKPPTPATSSGVMHVVSYDGKTLIRPKIPCVDSMTTYEGSDARSWRDVDSWFDSDTVNDDGTAYTMNDDDTEFSGAMNTFETRTTAKRSQAKEAVVNNKTAVEAARLEGLLASPKVRASQKHVVKTKKRGMRRKKK